MQQHMEDYCQPQQILYLTRDPDACGKSRQGNGFSRAWNTGELRGIKEISKWLQGVVSSQHGDNNLGEAAIPLGPPRNGNSVQIAYRFLEMQGVPRVWEINWIVLVLEAGGTCHSHAGDVADELSMCNMRRRRVTEVFLRAPKQSMSGKSCSK